MTRPERMRCGLAPAVAWAASTPPPPVPNNRSNRPEISPPGVRGAGLGQARFTLVVRRREVCHNELASSNDGSPTGRHAQRSSTGSSVCPRSLYPGNRSGEPMHARGRFSPGAA